MNTVLATNSTQYQNTTINHSINNNTNVNTEYNTDITQKTNINVQNKSQLNNINTSYSTKKENLNSNINSTSISSKTDLTSNTNNNYSNSYTTTNKTIKKVTSSIKTSTNYIKVNVDNYDDLKEYSEKTDNNYIITLSDGTYNPTSTIHINNNVTIITKTNAIIGSDNPYNPVYTSYNLNNLFIVGNNIKFTINNIKFTNIKSSSSSFNLINSEYSNSRLYITNCTFENISTVTYSTAALIKTNSIITIKNSIFNDITTAYGTVYNTNTLAIINSIFYDNKGQYGIISNQKGILKINNSTLNKNKMIGWDEGSGAIYNYHGRVNIINSNMNNNEITSSYKNGGGAIYNSYGTCNVINTTINNNSAKCDGGAIYNDHGKIGISKSIISNNSVTQDCGAIYNINGNITISNTRLYNNSAPYNGGVIYNKEGNIKITNSPVYNNKALLYGGAIYNKEGNITITSSTTNTNTAGLEGGVIYSLNGYITVSNSIINNNKAIQFGGAISSQNSKITITNSHINNNKVSLYEGGAININSGVLIIKKSELKNNQATQYGGAISSINGQIIIDNCTLYKNIVISYNGGAIYTTSSSLKISNSKIINCSSKSSVQAIYTDNNNLKLENNIITNGTINNTNYNTPIITYDSNIKQVNIVISPIITHAYDTVQLNATVTYSDGSVLNNQEVIFNINGVKLKTTTNNGKASVFYTVPGWDINTYKLIVTVEKTTTFNQTNAITTFTIARKNVIITMDKIFIGKTGNNIILNTLIKDYDNNIITSGTITFKINNKIISTVNVINGKASTLYSLKNINTGLYNVTATYNLNNLYSSTTTNSNLKVQSDIITFSREDILEAATRVKSSIENNSKLPNYVKIKNTEVTMPDFLYLMCQTLKNSTSLFICDFNNGTQAYTTTSSSNIYKTEYMQLADTLLYNYATTGKTQPVINISGGKISFGDTIYLYARALNYIYIKGSYPNYSTAISLIDPTSNIISSNLPSEYKKYLVSSNNCQVTSNTITSLVKKITSGITSTYKKALTIFNYVNDNTYFSDYSNTHYGAVGTLNRGYGNCVDLAHAIIALMRAAGIPARYVHANPCYFTGGRVSGHVWAEVYVNGIWYKCDASSNRNSFGVINNWYKATILSRYISLPF